MWNNKMKKSLKITRLVITILTLNLIVKEANSQTYKPNPETKKFEGSWHYKAGNIELILELKNYDKFYIKSISAYADVIQGNITYIRNGKTIYENENVIKNGRTGSTMPFELWGIYKEPNGKRGRLILSFENPNDLTILTLEIIPDKDLPRFKVSPLKIPEEIILKKVIK